MKILFAFHYTEVGCDQGEVPCPAGPDPTDVVCMPIGYPCPTQLAAKTGKAKMDSRVAN